MAPVRRGQLRLRRFERVEHGVDAGVAGDVRAPSAIRACGPIAMAERICSGVSVSDATIRGSSDRAQVVRAGAGASIAHERGAEQNPTVDEDLERTDTSASHRRCRTGTAGR